MTDFISCWDRIKYHTDIKTLSDLAEIADVYQSNVSRKKKENSFPADWAFKVAQKYNLSTDWILTGKTPINMSNIEHQNDDFLSNIVDWINDQKEDDEDIWSWFRIEFGKKFPEFKEWIKKYQESEAETSSRRVA